MTLIYMHSLIFKCCRSEFDNIYAGATKIKHPSKYYVLSGYIECRYYHVKNNKKRIYKKCVIHCKDCKQNEETRNLFLNKFISVGCILC